MFCGLVTLAGQRPRIFQGRKRGALKALSDRTDIAMKPADKGGGIVILNKPDYVKEDHHHLNNTPLHYTRLEAVLNVEH